MRASRTEDRRAVRGILRLYSIDFHAKELFADHVRGVLAELCKDILSVTGNSPGLHLLLDDRHELLENDQSVDLRCEVADELLRERMNKSELEHRSVGHGFTDIGIRNAARDEADLRVADLHAVQLLHGTCVLGELLHLILDDHMAADRVGRKHDIFRDILLIRLIRRLLARAEFDHALRMRESCRCADHDRFVVGLADLICELREILRFLRVRRLKDRDLGSSRYGARVLLVLGAVDSRIIGNAQDHAPSDTRVSCGIDRVCRDIKADHLHTCK